MIGGPLRYQEIPPEAAKQRTPRIADFVEDTLTSDTAGEVVRMLERAHLEKAIEGLRRGRDTS